MNNFYMKYKKKVELNEREKNSRWSEKKVHIRKLLPLTHPDFEIVTTGGNFVNDA